MNLDTHEIGTCYHGDGGFVMGKAVLKEIVDTVSKLPDDRKSQVLAYAKALTLTTEAMKPVKDWRDIVGTMPADKAENLQRVIEEGCRYVEPCAR
jgi:hypothetical protein